MKRTTTTREYDEEGRVVKEIVTEETEQVPVYRPHWGYPYWSVCTCGRTWGGCPIHPMTVSVSYGTTTTGNTLVLYSSDATRQDPPESLREPVSA